MSAVSLRAIDRAYAVAQAIPGWLMPEEAEYLYEVGRATDGQNIVEIGTYFGRSTYLIGQGILDAGSRALLITIDVHFRGIDPATQRPVILAEDSAIALLNTVKTYGLDRIVVPMLGWSELCVSALDFEGVGAVFIDGGHEFEDVTRDFRAVRARMTPGCTMKFMFHDYHPDFPGVVRAVDQCVRTDPGFRYIDLVHSLFVCSMTTEAGDPERAGPRTDASIATVQRLSAENVLLGRRLAEAEAERAVWQRQAEAISDATLWKATAPVRWILDRLRGRG